MNIKNIKKAALVLGLAAMLPTGVYGTIIWSDNFEGENGGNYQLDYTGFSKWDVTAGAVDLIGVGSPWDFGFGSTHGQFVDMDGSINRAGTMLSKSITLLAGNYVLSYDLAGNQRGAANDTIVVSVETGITPGSTITLSSAATFATYSDSFTVGPSGATINLKFAHQGGDNQGILLDNVRLEGVITSGASVPDAGTTLSLLGVGLVGLAGLRRKLS
jgi:hypothetical protein